MCALTSLSQPDYLQQLCTLLSWWLQPPTSAFGWVWSNWFWLSQL